MMKVKIPVELLLHSKLGSIDIRVYGALLVLENGRALPKEEIAFRLRVGRGAVDAAVERLRQQGFLSSDHVIALDEISASRARRTPIDAAVRRRVFERANHKCVYCGSNKHLTIDHAVPLGRGGAHSESNFVACCGKCNGEKGSMVAEEFLRARAN